MTSQEPGPKTSPMLYYITFAYPVVYLTQLIVHLTSESLKGISSFIYRNLLNVPQTGSYPSLPGFSKGHDLPTSFTRQKSGDHPFFLPLPTPWCPTQHQVPIHRTHLFASLHCHRCHSYHSKQIPPVFVYCPVYKSFLAGLFASAPTLQAILHVTE